MDRRKMTALILLICMIMCPVLAACSKGGPSGEAEPAGGGSAAYTDAKDAALTALSDRMAEEHSAVWVYRDFGMTENNFTQKAKMWGKDESLVKDMDENCTDDPYEGKSCIKCSQVTLEGDWGGWLFLNGYLPKGETVPKLNDGSTGGQGMDLSGATELRFAAKGENGGEAVEFFTAGFGYNGETGAKSCPHDAVQR